MADDIIQIAILEDGTIRVETGSISQVNHLSADTFLNAVDASMGGTVTIEPKHATHVHPHIGQYVQHRH